IIRQLFVKQEARRRGHATELVKHLLEHLCNKPNSQGNLFLIESPNKKSSLLFEKLGFFKKIGKDFTLINCGIISSGL
ncbi:MAG: GNAT family N-acetyltransferase, partial [Candidatus Helarchaeota archaeon]|nr:GNAT family N-acetyltransferase [Candidatus Helarchaeota archaeon]